jgi:hypothetical protein
LREEEREREGGRGRERKNNYWKKVINGETGIFQTVFVGMENLEKLMVRVLENEFL